MIKSFLKKIWQVFYKYWMKFAYVLGWINLRIIFTLLYIFLIGIYATINFLISLFKKKKNISNTYWLIKEYEEPTKEVMKRQF